MASGARSMLAIPVLRRPCSTGGRGWHVLTGYIGNRQFYSRGSCRVAGPIAFMEIRSTCFDVALKRLTLEYSPTTKRQTVVCCLYEICSSYYPGSNRLPPCLY
jgi:hypothetical protein